MDRRTEILNKFVEFQSFLSGVSLEELSKLSRQDLMEFRSELNNIKIRSLSYEVQQVIDQKKKEEFPELLGVYRYPDLNEIDYLTDKLKVELDKQLGSLRVGDYILRLGSYPISPENLAKLDLFLLAKGIAQEWFVIRCPHCRDGHLSKLLLRDDYDSLVAQIKEATDEEFENMEAEGVLESYCMECEDHVDLTILKDKELYVSRYLKLAKKRDTSLDNA